jgi:hypothetical protein
MWLMGSINPMSCINKYARMFYHQLDPNPTGAGRQATSNKQQAEGLRQIVAGQFVQLT